MKKRNASLKDSMKHNRYLLRNLIKLFFKNKFQLLKTTL